MATTPNDPNKPDKANQQLDLEQQVLMREVDEAVRIDEVASFWRSYGKPLIAGVVLGLAAFGGYLYWQSRQEASLEQQSEALVKAMDELNAGNLSAADGEFAVIGDNPDSSPGARASANMYRASIALEQDRVDDAVAFYDRVVNDDDAPKVMRDASQVRLVSANFDAMDKQDVIDRLLPLATPDSAWFGSAGELVAHAYLDQNKPDLAGPLLVQIAQTEGVPETLRARSRQLAGSLGFDAIDDVADLVGDGSDEGAEVTPVTPAAAQ